MWPELTYMFKYIKSPLSPSVYLDIRYIFACIRVFVLGEHLLVTENIRTSQPFSCDYLVLLWQKYNLSLASEF